MRKKTEGELADGIREELEDLILFILNTSQVDSERVTVDFIKGMLHFYFFDYIGPNMYEIIFSFEPIKKEITDVCDEAAVSIHAVYHRER